MKTVTIEFKAPVGGGKAQLKNIVWKALIKNKKIIFVQSSSENNLQVTFKEPSDS